MTQIELLGLGQRLDLWNYYGMKVTSYQMIGWNMLKRQHLQYHNIPQPTGNL